MTQDNERERSAYEGLMSLPDPTLQPERVLWLHVLAQAMIDGSSRNKEIKDEVRAWRNSEDFEILCGMAGVNATHVGYALDAILRDRNPKRAFKKAMSFRFLIRTYIDSNRGDIDKQKGLEK